MLNNTLLYIDMDAPLDMQEASLLSQVSFTLSKGKDLIITTVFPTVS